MDKNEIAENVIVKAYPKKQIEIKFTKKMAYLQEGKNTFPFVISVYSVRDYFTRHYRKKIVSHRGHKVHGVKKLWVKMR
jgi:hypothetical protein